MNFTVSSNGETMLRRMVRAARLDGQVYQEVRDGPGATLQALGVVALGGVSLGLAGVVQYTPSGGAAAQVRLLSWSIASFLMGWVAVGGAVYLVGRWLLRQRVTLRSLLRVLGFAQAPGLLYLLIAVPNVAPLALLTNAVILLWTLVATAVALWHTLRISSVSALGLALVGLVLALSVRNFLAQAMSVKGVAL